MQFSRFVTDNLLDVNLSITNIVCSSLVSQLKDRGIAANPDGNNSFNTKGKLQLPSGFKNIFETVKVRN